MKCLILKRKVFLSNQLDEVKINKMKSLRKLIFFLSIYSYNQTWSWKKQIGHVWVLVDFEFTLRVAPNVCIDALEACIPLDNGTWTAEDFLRVPSSASVRTKLEVLSYYSAMKDAPSKQQSTASKSYAYPLSGRQKLFQKPLHLHCCKINNIKTFNSRSLGNNKRSSW